LRSGPDVRSRGHLEEEVAALLAALFTVSLECCSAGNVWCRSTARTILESNFKAGQDLGADAIHSHLSQHFAKWQLPEVIFTDAVKRTSVGNADKKRLRAEYERLYLNETSPG
jgi:acyl-CoA synthetase (AMP-forming)/AMP-acid ligase II